MATGGGIRWQEVEQGGIGGHEVDSRDRRLDRGAGGGLKLHEMESRDRRLDRGAGG